MLLHDFGHAPVANHIIGTKWSRGALHAGS